jgi:thiamine pyrophosphokinase
MKVVVLAGGTLGDSDRLRPLVELGDLIVAADGGARHAVLWGRLPDMVVGDLDSLSLEEAEYLEGQGVTILRHPPGKDQTDLELALDLARDKARDHGAAEVLLLGAWGGRWDMTLANALLLQRYSGEPRIRLTDGCHDLWLVETGGPWPVDEEVGDTVSFLPVGGLVKGVTLGGMVYPLNQATLAPGTTWAVSNVVKEPGAWVRVDEGRLLGIRIRKSSDSDR